MAGADTHLDVPENRHLRRRATRGVPEIYQTRLIPWRASKRELMLAASNIYREELAGIRVLRSFITPFSQINEVQMLSSAVHVSPTI